eukprot:10008914-Alexandrium_andersonii.AAC.1
MADILAKEGRLLRAPHQAALDYADRGREALASLVGKVQLSLLGVFKEMVRLNGDPLFRAKCIVHRAESAAQDIGNG